MCGCICSNKLTELLLVYSGYTLPFPDIGTRGYATALEVWEPPAGEYVFNPMQRLQSPRTDSWFERIVNVVGVQGIKRNDFWTAWGYCNRCDCIVMGSVYDKHYKTNCGTLE